MSGFWGAVVNEHPLHTYVDRQMMLNAEKIFELTGTPNVCWFLLYTGQCINYFACCFYFILSTILESKNHSYHSPMYEETKTKLAQDCAVDKWRSQTSRSHTVQTRLLFWGIRSRWILAYELKWEKKKADTE